MVTIMINNQAICVSTAQAYAIKLILRDYAINHKLAKDDGDALLQLDKMFTKATIFLHPLDQEQIYKATLHRNNDGVVDHWGIVDSNDL